jgi:hypothetical protein
MHTYDIYMYIKEKDKFDTNSLPNEDYDYVIKYEYDSFEL